eukprot:SAG11_NODE_4098_length_2066_cov_0.814438_2_plen_156_part_00
MDRCVHYDGDSDTASEAEGHCYPPNVQQGSLDKEEIRQLVDYFELTGTGPGGTMADYELEAAMAQMDEDLTGEVEYNEFRAWYVDWQFRQANAAKTRAEGGALEDETSQSRWPTPARLRRKLPPPRNRWRQPQHQPRTGWKRFPRRREPGGSAKL